MSEPAVVVAAARAWIGTPYVHQASVQGGGADCLGLIRGVWRTLHGDEPETAPPYTPDWGEFEANELLLEGATRHLLSVARDSELGPGQILLFRMRAGAIAKHLGIVVETGEAPRFVHAYSHHGVIESPLTAPWRSRVVARFRFP
ncbi:NlpC/P60 family protein [Paracoccus salsus]|uniref:NlpC/P60 family protein n=1 Tax=Paracoccus salsus TaxID=2911061 RepID=UPI001F23A7A2|nr:NlpC/P60 family protein [Paracoccus salsus]MCF3974797.1 peptidase [Paracoccus salsus]